MAGVLLAAVIPDGLPSPDRQLVWWHGEWRLPIQGGANLPTLVSSYASPIAGSGTAESGLIFNIVDGAGGGNCLVVGGQCSSGTTVTYADDKNNTPSAVITDTNASDTQMGWLFHIENVVAGTRKITISFSPNAAFFSGWVLQFYNVATTNAADGSGHNNGNADTSWLTTQLTTTVANDLIVYQGQNTHGGGQTVTAGAQGSGFALSVAQSNAEGMFVQWQVWASSGNITPGITASSATNFVSIAIALKSASAGTAPSGAAPIILRLQDCFVPQNSTSFVSQFPCTGNLLAAMYVTGGGTPVINSFTSSPSNTWTQDPNSPTTNVPLQAYYSVNPSTATTLTITLGFSAAVAGGPIAFYDITGADGAAPRVFSKTNTGNQTTQGDITLLTLTAADGILANQLALYVSDQATETILSFTSAPLFDMALWPGQDETGAGGAGNFFTDDAARGHYQTASSADVNFTEHASAGANAGIGPWAALAIVFKGPSAFMPPPWDQNEDTLIRM